MKANQEPTVSFDRILRRAGGFFMGRSAIHAAMRSISRALQETGVPFAIAGAMAVNAHGLRRETEDLDILMTREGLATFKEKWLGRGWVEKFSGSKGLRDTVNDVKIDVLLSGEYPGDGKPKPVVFPDPAEGVCTSIDGLAYLSLPRLFELKIASGMTAPHRLRDLDDAQRLIRANKLAQDYALKLDPYVQPKFRELWQLAQIDEDY